MNDFTLSSHLLVQPDGFPLDWNNEIQLKGFSRNKANKSYVSKISVAHRQWYLGETHSQRNAAQLYDLAVWKFAPKMTRHLRPNFPEDFSFITQEFVTRAVPRLDRLYDMIPFLQPDDASVPEETLRERALNRKTVTKPKGLGPIDELLLRNRASRSHIESEGAALLKMRGRMPLISKIPEVQASFQKVLSLIAQLSDAVGETEAALLRNRQYYLSLELQEYGRHL